MMAKGMFGQSNEVNEARKLVMGFVEYTTKVLNEDMKPFFEKHMDEFDQADSDLADGTGHTVEQYEIFRKYESILEGKIDDFATDKGYSSAVDCFRAIQDALETEKSSHKTLMADLQKQFAAMRSALMKSVEKDDSEADAKGDGSSSSSLKGGDGVDAAGSKMDSKGGAKMGGSEGKGEQGDSDGNDAKAGAKGGDGDEDADAKGGGGGGGGSSKGVANDGEEDEDEPPPLMAMPFFAPLPLERMLESILRLTEYDTFSQIMRTKVKQLKFARALEQRIRNQRADQEERSRQLDLGGKYLESGELFGWLQTRMADMLPQGLGGDRDSIYQFLDKETWDRVMSKVQLETNEEKLELKRLVSFTFGHMQRLGLIEDFMSLRRLAVELMADIDKADMRVPEVATKYLRMSHEVIDEAEQNLYKAFVDNKII